MQDEPTLDVAYTLRTPDDNRALYARWAADYDSSFAQNMDYRLPFTVARSYHIAGGIGPVLDVGAGTGLCAHGLREQGIAPIDGVDISPEMLEIAQQKSLYDTTHVADLTQGLDMADGTYAGAVSAGTFTLGHLGPECLAEVIRVVRPGGLIVISVARAHYDAAGFGPALDTLGATLQISQIETPIYGPDHAGHRAADMAMIVTIHR